MKTRPVVAAVFVVCCLLLCGLILRHQIAGHPLPPEIAQRYRGNGGDQGEAFRLGMQGWQPASPALGALAHQTMAGQLAAMKAGDGPKVWTYQSHNLRQRFSSPALFMQTISSQYPAFTHYRRVEYRQMLVNRSGQQVQALVVLEDENGRQVPAVYMLVREAGEFKVAGVQPLFPPAGQH